MSQRVARTGPPDGRIVSLSGRERAAAVATLLGLAQIHRAPSERDERGPAIAEEYARSDHFRLWGFERGGRILSVAGVESAGDGTTVLRDLAVDPSERRCGIGRALLAFLQRQHPVAVTGFTLDEAAEFYSRCGFDVCEDGVMPSGETRYSFTWESPHGGGEGAR